MEEVTGLSCQRTPFVSCVTRLETVSYLKLVKQWNDVNVDALISVTQMMYVGMFKTEILRVTNSF